MLHSYSNHISRRLSKNWICEPLIKKMGILYVLLTCTVQKTSSASGADVLTLSLMRPCRICQRRFMSPSRSAKSVLSVRLLSMSWPLICSTDWFTKSTVSCLQLRSTLKPWMTEREKRQQIHSSNIIYSVSKLNWEKLLDLDQRSTLYFCK